MSAIAKPEEPGLALTRAWRDFAFKLATSRDHKNIPAVSS